MKRNERPVYGENARRMADQLVLAEARHLAQRSLFCGVRRRGPVQWASICIVLAMVIALFWLAFHYSGSHGF